MMKWFKKAAAKLKPSKEDKAFDLLNHIDTAAKAGDVAALEKHFGGFTDEYTAVSLTAHYALICACEGGSEPAVRYLLGRGVPPDLTFSISLMTPEEMAAKGGHHHILLVLREHMIKAGKQPTELMERAQALAEAQKMLELTKVVTSAPVLQNDISVREKPLKLKLKPAKPPEAG